MKKGEIYEAENCRKHPHKFVFLEKNDNESFKACIITTKSGFKENKIMLESHFHKKDENQAIYKIQYKNTHLVSGIIFIKLNSWLKSNPKPVGKLTSEGIHFIEEWLKDVEMIFKESPIWE